MRASTLLSIGSAFAGLLSAGPYPSFATQNVDTETVYVVEVTEVCECPTATALPTVTSSPFTTLTCCPTCELIPVTCTTQPITSCRQRTSLRQRFALRRVSRNAATNSTYAGTHLVQLNILHHVQLVMSVVIQTAGLRNPTIQCSSTFKFTSTFKICVSVIGMKIGNAAYIS